MVMVPVDVFSSTFSPIAAPGRQRATRGRSTRKPHTFSGAALTTKVLAISRAIGEVSGLGGGCGKVALGSEQELFPAPRVAEEVAPPVVLGTGSRGGHHDRHAADRIERL